MWVAGVEELRGRVVYGPYATKALAEKGQPNASWYVKVEQPADLRGELAEVMQSTAVLRSKVLDEFWSRFGDLIELTAKVSVSESAREQWPKDSLGDGVYPESGIERFGTSPVWLVFVDRSPMAQWPHRCAWVYLQESLPAEEGAWVASLIEAQWPPRSDVLMRKVTRGSRW